MKKSAVFLAAASTMTLAAALPDKPFFRLLDAASKASPAENVLLSPFGLQQCYGMMAAGAGERTAAELRDVLALDASGIREIGAARASISGSGDKFKSFNIIAVDRKYRLRKNFMEQAEKFFDARLLTADFSRPADAAALLNGLIRKNTGGMFERVFDDTELDNSAMLLLDLLSFKDRWQTPFDREMTAEKPFRSASGSAQRAEMMRGILFLPYYNDGEIHGITMNYRDRRFRMTVLMPVSDKVPLTAVTEKLAKNGFAGMIGNFAETRRTDVWLPKLALSSEIDLKKLLTGVGMTALFDPRRSDLDGIAEGEVLYVFKSKQLVKLNMNEQGTEVAAVTYAQMMCTGVFRPQKPDVFHADRPFVLVLWDSETGAVLLTGAVNRL